MQTPSDTRRRDGEPLTLLLDAAARGDRSAFDRAFAVLYEELRSLAHAQRRRWQGNETLDTRVLVHEAYLKLVRPGEGAGAEPAAGDAVASDSPRRWEGRRHFFALASQVMRHVLVSYAEQQRTAKRGGDVQRVGLDALETPPGPNASAAASAAFQVALSAEEPENVLSLHEALARLETREPRQARIIECRFFGGLSIPETAEALDISPATVKREWQAASAWLYAELAQSR
jgi:RNA polymerase sigma factor (TIGR02999 family)